MRDRRLLLASRQGVELLRYSGLGCGGRSQGAVGDRPSGGLQAPAQNCATEGGRSRCEGFGGAKTEQKNINWNSASLIRILYMYMRWGPLESGARGGRPSRPPSGPGLTGGNLNVLGENSAPRYFQVFFLEEIIALLTGFRPPGLSNCQKNQ